MDQNLQQKSNSKPIVIEQIEQELIDNGSFSSPPSLQELEDPLNRERYRAVLLTERLMQASHSKSWREQQEPSTEELERGFFQVMARLQKEEQAIALPVKAKDEAFENTIRVVFLNFLEQVQKSFFAQSAWLGLGAFTLLGVVWFGSDYNDGKHLQKVSWGQKGKGQAVSQRQAIQMTFGLSKESEDQPRQRGIDGMSVVSGSWLYFRIDQEKIDGYVTIIRLRSDGSFRQLFPLSSQRKKISKGPRHWILNHRGVALRFRLKKKHQHLGFFVLLTSKPLGRAIFKKLSAPKKLLSSSSRLRLWLVTRLKLSAIRIHGFTLRVRL